MTINEQIADGARTIVLTQDTDESIVVPIGVNMTLDLAGHTLRGDGVNHTIENNGILKIVDSSTEQTGTIYNNVKSKGCVFNNFGGELVVDSATLARGELSWYCLLNWGEKVTINYVKIDCTGDAAAISNGFYSPSVDNPNKVFATMVIKDALITTSGSPNACVKNDEYGIMLISGGSYTSQSHYAVNSWNELTITGGTFKSVESKPLVCGSTPGDGGHCELNITGGTFSGATGIMNDCSDGQDSEGYVAPDWNITGGKYNMPIESAFIDKSMALVPQADGSYGVAQVPKKGWKIVKSPLGPGLWGNSCGVYRMDTVEYTAGGIELNFLDFTPEVLLNVSARGGVTGYLNNGKLQLFRAGVEVSGTVTDLTVVLLG